MQVLTAANAITLRLEFDVADDGHRLRYVRHYPTAETHASLIPSALGSTLRIHYGSELVIELSNSPSRAGNGNEVLGLTDPALAFTAWVSAVSAAMSAGGGGGGTTAPDPNTADIKLNTAATTAAISNKATEATLATRLKPADTLTGVATVGAVTSITNALPVGSNVIGKVSIDQTAGQNKVSLGTDFLNVVAASTASTAETTVGVVAADIVAANAARKYVEIQNLDATNPVYIRFGGTASIANSTYIAPRGWYYSASSAVSTAKISIIGIVPSQKIAYLELT